MAGWLTVFLLFFAVPMGSLYEGYRIYSASQTSDARDRMIQYYTRELTSLRTNVSNERVLLQIFHSFRENYQRHFKTPAKNETLFQETLKELPASSTIILWNQAGVATLQGVPIPAPDSLVNLLRKGHSRFSDGSALQNADGPDPFLQEMAPTLKALQPVLGKNFPVQRAVLAPGSLVAGEDPSQPCVLYWDLVHDQGNPQGGFVAIIPGRSLTETFGLSYVLASDQAANPEFSNGFASLNDPNVFQVSYPGLEQIAKRMFTEYRLSLESPTVDGDWVFVVIPLTESSVVRLFSAFSVRRYRLTLETSAQNGLIACLILLAIGALLFRQAYRRAITTGLSIRIKVAGLFLLSLMLPLSLLLLLGLHYSLDRAKILTVEANQRLQREMKRLDDNVVEFCRTRANLWQTFKDLDAVRNPDPPVLAATFKDFQSRKQLERVYLVDAAGKVLFDQDSLFPEASRKAFAGELGRQAIQMAGLTSSPGGLERSEKDVLSRALVNRLAGQRGLIHQMVWPGTTTKVYVYIDLVPPPPGSPADVGPRALIVTMDKQNLDREYLHEAIRNQQRRAHDLRFFAMNREDLTDTVPELQPIFKANLLPLIALSQIRETPDAEQVPDGDQTLLVSMTPGKLLEDFLLGAHLDHGEVMASITMMYGLIAIALVLSGLGGLTLVTLFSRGFIQPISILSQGTRAIAMGDLTKVLPVHEKDELGDLSQAFNDMTKRLRNRLTELTVLYNLTQKASTTHNQREVFELAARHLKEHLGATDCGTSWINEGEGQENLYLAENRDATLAATIRKTVGEAIQKRNLHFGPFPTKDAGGVLGIPLFFEEKEFGGIYLMFRQSLARGTQLTLTSDERSFIETLRHHLSLIVEKQRLFEQAITDGLTRLYVRRFFLGTLEKELARARRYKTDLSLLLLDIDHFKKFNDSYGHQVGDLVLRETAQRIIESIRAVDTPGRYGGEEMAVILPQTPVKDGLLVAERIRATIEGAVYPHNEFELHVTVSIGVTSLCGRGPTVEAMVEEVDKALYRAKAEGRNRVILADGLDPDAPPATPPVPQAAQAPQPPQTPQAPQGPQAPTPPEKAGTPGPRLAPAPKPPTRPA